jgi:hypothetical protein
MHGPCSQQRVQRILRRAHTEKVASVNLPRRPWLVNVSPVITTLFLTVLFGWAAFNWFETVERILHHYVALPFADYWRVAENFEKYTAFDLRILWKQHNDHRIVFPEIVFAADMLLVHGRQILPLSVSFLCYVAGWIALAFALFSDKNLSFAFRTSAILLAGVIIGWEGSAVLLANAFLLQWTLFQIAVILALVFTSLTKEKTGNHHLTCAIVAATVATYSSANGMVLWPVLLTAGTILSFSKRQMAAIGVSAAVAVGVYFVGYRFGSSLNFANLFLHPFYTFGFVGSYLSMPFGGMKAPQFGAYLGLTSILIAVILFVATVRARLLPSMPAITFFGFYTVVLLSAILAAAGRMDPKDSYFSNAKPGRYVTLPLMNWAVLVLLLLWISSRLRWKIVPAPVIFVLVTVLASIGFLKLSWRLQDDDDEWAERQFATLSIENGLMDPDLVKKMFPDPGFVLIYLPILREHHLSIFYKTYSRFLSKPARSLGTDIKATIEGAISYTYPMKPGVEAVVGWVDQTEENGKSKWLVLLNEAGTISGLGERLPAGLPRSLRMAQVPHSIAWVGFVNLQSNATSFSAHLIGRRGLVPIDQAFPIAPIDYAKPKETGPTISGLKWYTAPSLDSGMLPDVELGPVPGQPIYSTWAGSDQNTGQISSSAFAVPPSSCFILPIVHGPSVDGLSAQITDADTGRALRFMPMQSNVSQWLYWRVSLNSTTKHVRVTAEDEGRGWGQWLAIAQPVECR